MVFKTCHTERAEARLSGTGQIQLEMAPIRRTCWFCYFVEIFMSKKKRKLLLCDN